MLPTKQLECVLKHPLLLSLLQTALLLLCQISLCCVRHQTSLACKKTPTESERYTDSGCKQSSVWPWPQVARTKPPYTAANSKCRGSTEINSQFSNHVRNSASAKARHDRNLGHMKFERPALQRALTIQQSRPWPNL